MLKSARWGSSSSFMHSNLVEEHRDHSEEAVSRHLFEPFLSSHVCERVGIVEDFKCWTPHPSLFRRVIRDMLNEIVCQPERRVESRF